MDLQEETCIVAVQINELKIKAIAVGILANSLEMSSEVLFQGPPTYRTFWNKRASLRGTSFVVHAVESNEHLIWSKTNNVLLLCVQSVDEV